MKSNELENVHILNQHGFEALKAIFLLNGGSSIALLAFLGTLAVSEKDPRIGIQPVAEILFWFAIGSGLCVLAYSLNYLNILFALYDRNALSNTLLGATIIAAAASVALFFCGIYSATHVFS